MQLENAVIVMMISVSLDFLKDDVVAGIPQRSFERSCEPNGDNRRRLIKSLLSNDV